MGYVAVTTQRVVIYGVPRGSYQTLYINIRFDKWFINLIWRNLIGQNLQPWYKDRYLHMQWQTNVTFYMASAHKNGQKHQMHVYNSNIFVAYTHWWSKNQKVARTELLVLNAWSPSLLKRPSKVR